MKHWTPVQLYNHILGILRREYPKVKIVSRERIWWARVMENLGCPPSVITTVYHTIAVPRDWNTYSYSERASILWHEIQHLRQARSLGGDFFGWFCVFGPAYLFLPFPIAWTFRAKYERQAFAEGLRAYFLLGLEPARAQWTNSMIEVFSSKAYLYMWPFKHKIRKWTKEVWANMMHLRAIRRLDEPYKF